MNSVHIEEWFQDLIDRTREFLQGQEQGPILTVDLSEVLVEFWDNWFNPLLEAWTPQIRRDLCEFFLGQMRLHPGDVAVRYTALAVYDGFIRYLADFDWFEKPTPPSIHPFRGDPPSPARRPGVLAIEIPSWKPHIALLREDFRSVLHFVNTEDIEHWRDIRWEISNSCLAEDWARAFRLYGRTAELRLVDDGELGLLRGQFQFLLAFRETPVAPLQADILRNNGPFLRKADLVLHPSNWEPELHDTPDSLSSLLLFASGLSFSTGDPEAPRPDHGILRDAIDALERTRELKELPPPYQAVLARCYSAAGRFYDAAAQYEQLSKMELGGTWCRLSPHVYRALAATYVSAEEPAKAIKALQVCSSKFPTETDIYLKTAQLQAQETDIASVTETLRKAVDNIPSLDQDWRISCLVALGETAQGANLSLRKVDPEKHEIIVALLGEYWRPFGKLSTEAQDEWIFGTDLLHFPTAQKAMAKTYTRKGLTALATAAEIELLQRVFTPLRDYFNQNEGLRRLISEELELGEEERQDQKVRPFCLFVVGRRHFSIGFVWMVINLCQHPRTPVFVAIREWLDHNFPKLLPLAGTLDNVRRFRNLAVHEGISTSTTNEIPEECRKIINSVLCYDLTR